MRRKAFVLVLRLVLASPRFVREEFLDEHIGPLARLEHTCAVALVPTTGGEVRGSLPTHRRFRWVFGFEDHRFPVIDRRWLAGSNARGRDRDVGILQCLYEVRNQWCLCGSG